jgi:F-box and WD-40 domain protein 1/11
MATNDLISGPLAGPSSLRGDRSSSYRRVRPKLPTKHSMATRSMSDFSGIPGASIGSSRGSRTRPSTPRFSKLLGAVMNSPLLIPASAEQEIVMVDGTFVGVPSSQTVTRPPSPSPTENFSLLSPPSPMSFVHVVPPASSGVYDVFTSPTSGPEGTPSCTLFISSATNSMRRSPSKLGKATLGRIWGALSSPAKRGKVRSVFGSGLFDGLPLDGEEGELIDEACYIAVRRVTGMGEYCNFFLSVQTG